MQQFLLEKARVVGFDEGHRNFHIFYFLLAGATPEEKQKYQLMEPWDYAYLSCNDWKDRRDPSKGRKKDFKDNYVVYAMKDDGRSRLCTCRAGGLERVRHYSVAPRCIPARPHVVRLF